MSEQVGIQSSPMLECSIESPPGLLDARLRALARA
jgi:hypothetical protein